MHQRRASLRRHSARQPGGAAEEAAGMRDAVAPVPPAAGFGKLVWKLLSVTGVIHLSTHRGDHESDTDQA